MTRVNPEDIEETLLIPCGDGRQLAAITPLFSRENLSKYR
jgi:hypothetical protein